MLFCPGLVKLMLGHSFGRSWYMRLFHTPRTSSLLTTRLWKLARVLFLFPERTWEHPLEPLWIPLCVSIHKLTRWNQNTVLVFTCSRWRQGVLYVIQSLPHPDSGCVTRFADGFVSGLPFSSPSFPLPHLKSPLPLLLRKAWYSG